jgi:hypothetical protein
LREQIIQDVMTCEWSVSWKKSQFNPSQQVNFLGFIIDSRNSMIKAMEKRLTEVREVAGVLLGKKGGKVRIREIAHIAEKILALS